MVFESKNLGTIEYNEDAIVTFEKGLLGFEEYKKYIVIRNENSEFYYLQSLEEAEVTFILVDLKHVMPNYDPEVELEQLKDLGEIKENLDVYNICTVQDDLEEMTVNLLGPVVINKDTNKGRQVVVTKDEYSIKHKLFR